MAPYVATHVDRMVTEERGLIACDAIVDDSSLSHDGNTATS